MCDCVTVFGCGSVATPARSWVQSVAIDRVIVRCNDTDTSWTLVCDGDVWRSTTVAISNCSTTAALTGNSGSIRIVYSRHVATEAKCVLVPQV